MANKPGIPVKKSSIKDTLNKPVEIRFSALVPIAKSLIGYNTGNIPFALKDLTDLIKEFKINNDSGLAWFLVYRALYQSIIDLIKENTECSKFNIVSLLNYFDESLNHSEFFIDSTFLKYPKNLSIVKKIQEVFLSWLRENGLNFSISETITGRLPSYFVFSLAREWSENRSKYESLEKSLVTPFESASQNEYQWFQYSAWLQKRTDEKMFDESFSLRQIYIPPRAYYKMPIHEKNSSLKNRLRQTLTDESFEKIVVDLESELEKWADSNDINDAIRVISAGPGHGKSSFCNIFAAKQSELGKIRVILIPLHNFEVSEDLAKAIGNYIISYDRFLKDNPLAELKNDGNKLLIIFDGLDELSQQGKFATELAEKFIREVEKNVHNFNNQGLRLKILISGRELLIQKNESEFRKEKQIMHLLPYYILDSERYTYNDKNYLLYEDQRQSWWKKYAQLSGKNFDSMPESLNDIKLQEITSQPLLNYLIALTYQDGDFNSGDNINSLYSKLIEYVFKRDWSNAQHPTLNNVFLNDFFEILEDVAVATWHGNGKTASLKEIEKQFSNNRLKDLLEKIYKDVQKGILGLLLSFFFRQNGLNSLNDSTFEFTHKSFGEYLFMRRIVSLVNNITEELERKNKNSRTGWSEEQALEEWVKLTGPKPIDEYLFSYIHREILLESDIDKIKNWQKTLCKLIEYILREGLPMDKLNTSLPSFYEKTKQARNSEEALLIMANACASKTLQLSQINWNNQIEFSSWLMKLHGQRQNYDTIFILEHLSYLSLNNITLINKDLVNANLEYSDLNNSNLKYANLYNANLTNTTLKNADLSHSHLSKANLKKSDLSYAKLIYADLSYANLSYADLSNTDLRYADLSNADLSYANLTNADLSDSNLSKTNLNYSNLSSTNLSNATLINTEIYKANLYDTDLSNATFKFVDFTDINLNYIKFIHLFYDDQWLEYDEFKQMFPDSFDSDL